MSYPRVAFGVLAAALALSACSSSSDAPAEQTVATPAPTISTEAQSGVDKLAADAGTVTPLPPATPIQSQPGSDGTQVDLMTVKVTGDILTVTFRCSGPERIKTEVFSADQISVIDDTTSQRIGILKDGDGNWMASKLSGQSVTMSCATRPGIMWAKFPAPPATSPTVSINLPGVAPFDGVPVAR